MKKQNLLTIAAACAISVVGLALHPLSAADYSTEANVWVEIAFQAQRVHADPFNNLTLDVCFTGPDGVVCRVPGFWAGGSSWRVRYASAAVGRHTFRSECSDVTDTGLHAIEGAVVVTPYTGDNALLRRGPLRIAQDRRHFTYADGSPFFWLGDTWWMGLCQRLQWPDEFQRLAADRRAKGFTVIQLVAGLYPDMPAFDERGQNEAGFPWETDYARVRPDYFDAADRRIQYLVDQGFVPCIVGAWGYHLPWLGTDKMKQHWRYLIARWGALPVVWCAAGEGTMPYYLSQNKAAESELQQRGWTEVIRYLRATDPFHRLVTIHPSRTARESVTDPLVLDFDMQQSGHGRPAEQHAALAQDGWNTQPVMPVISGESRYEALEISPTLDATAARQAFWAHLLASGCAGHTYGANGIWQVNRTDQPFGNSPGGHNWGTTPWDQAMQLPGSTQVAAAKRLIESLPNWWRLEPQPARAIRPDQGPSTAPGPICAAAGQDLTLVYLLSPMTVQLRDLQPSTQYRVRWFDPIRAEVASDTVLSTDANQTITVSPPHDGHQDWVVVVQCPCASRAQETPVTGTQFEGQFYGGRGDLEYLRLLDTARRMFAPDPELQHLGMLYIPTWNGLVEGPTWDAWWIQNSYGTTYCALPFLEEPFSTFLQNSQDLWFDQMGDGQRVGAGPPFDWVAPDGCLCDAARPGWIVYRQGDGRPEIHDWGMEFTAAGLLLQSELLLISRDPAAIARYLPRLERCANFIETRRDPANNLFLAGPAGNLLAPSFAGWKKPDGTYDKAYLTGLSITYIAALDRLIELEKLAGRPDQAQQQKQRRDTARQGLTQLVTEEGYFIRSLDPDGTRHGVFGAAKHGYFEASPNHDAIALRVADDAQAARIYAQIASIPGLRPHQFILPNYPSYDDMYEAPQGLWEFGTWVNGGHWSTCEARMILAYYRLGKFDDAQRSLRQLLTFAARFRMDNPLVKFGADVYQPGQPINLTYDAFGPPAAFVRGLFEYLYHAEGVTILPHVPPSITQLEQRFPIRLGRKRLYLATVGTGPITGVTVNGKAWQLFDRATVTLPHDQIPETAVVELALGGASPRGFQPVVSEPSPRDVPPHDATWLALRKPNLATNDLPVRIGADSNGQSRFRGDLARVRLFQRALRADEIAALQHGDQRALATDPTLVADWKLDQMQDGAFVSRNGANLQARVVGKVEMVDDTVMGKVVRVDGSGYLEVADCPALDLTDACTLEAWICPRELPPGGGRLIDKSQVGTSNGYLLDTYPSNSLRLISQAGAISHTAPLVAGQWIHVAGTVDSEGRRALYIQGKQVAHEAAPSLPDVGSLLLTTERLHRFHRLLADSGLVHSYEAAHARLVIDSMATAHERLTLLQLQQLKPLSDPASQAAADQSYLDTARKLTDGLLHVLSSYGSSIDPQQQRIAQFWQQSAAEPN